MLRIIKQINPQRDSLITLENYAKIASTLMDKDEVTASLKIKFA